MMKLVIVGVSALYLLGCNSPKVDLGTSEGNSSLLPNNQSVSPVNGSGSAVQDKCQAIASKNESFYGPFKFNSTCDKENDVCKGLYFRTSAEIDNITCRAHDGNDMPSCCIKQRDIHVSCSGERRPKEQVHLDKRCRVHANGLNVKTKCIDNFCSALSWKVEANKTKKTCALNSDRSCSNAFNKIECESGNPRDTDKEKRDKPCKELAHGKISDDDMKKVECDDEENICKGVFTNANKTFESVGTHVLECNKGTEDRTVITKQAAESNHNCSELSKSIPGSPRSLCVDAFCKDIAYFGDQNEICSDKNVDGSLNITCLTKPKRSKVKCDRTRHEIKKAELDANCKLKNPSKDVQCDTEMNVCMGVYVNKQNSVCCSADPSCGEPLKFITCIESYNISLPFKKFNKKCDEKRESSYCTDNFVCSNLYLANDLGTCYGNPLHKHCCDSNRRMGCDGLLRPNKIQHIRKTGSECPVS